MSSDNMGVAPTGGGAYNNNRNEEGKSQVGKALSKLWTNITNKVADKLGNASSARLSSEPPGVIPGRRVSGSITPRGGDTRPTGVWQRAIPSERRQSLPELQPNNKTDELLENVEHYVTKNVTPAAKPTLPSHGIVQVVTHKDIDTTLKSILKSVKKSYNLKISKYNQSGDSALKDNLDQLGELCKGTKHEPLFNEVKNEIDKRDEKYNKMDQNAMKKSMDKFQGAVRHMRKIYNNGTEPTSWQDTINKECKPENFGTNWGVLNKPEKKRTDKENNFVNLYNETLNELYSNMESATYGRIPQPNKDSLQTETKFNAGFEEAFNSNNGNNETRQNLKELKRDNPMLYEHLKGRFEFTDEQLNGQGKYTAPTVK